MDYYFSKLSVILKIVIRVKIMNFMRLNPINYKFRINLKTIMTSWKEKSNTKWVAQNWFWFRWFNQKLRFFFCTEKQEVNFRWKFLHFSLEHFWVILGNSQISDQFGLRSPTFSKFQSKNLSQKLKCLTFLSKIV